MKYIVILLLGLVVSCASVEEPTVALTYHIHAKPDINPNINGEPSPVIVRVYQLSNITNFNNTTYESLFNSPTNVLGTEFISMNEYLIYPDKKSSIMMEISEATKFLGVAVGYRSLENVTWKTFIDMPDDSLFFSKGIIIEISTLSVRVVEI